MLRSILAFAVSVFLAFTSQAETVLVRSGQSMGQGWVFLDHSGCWLATPAHVVRSEAGILVVGPSGRQGFSTSIHIHPTDDLAIARIAGELATHCPGSPRGDVDTRPTLRRAVGQGQEISFERRGSGGSEGSFGVDVVPLQIVAIPESGSVFTVRPTKQEADAVVQSDSGSPVRMRGMGVGDSGYPLGLIISVLEEGGLQYVDVIRMDRVRAFHEQVAAQASAARNTPLGFSITGFTGETAESSCSPHNLLTPRAQCGWKVRRGSDRQYPSITVRLASTSEINGVALTLRNTDKMAGASVSVRRPDGTWSAERYCPGSSEQLLCNITPTLGQEVKLVLNALQAEVLNLEVR